MNRLYPHPIIAREGWPIIGGGLALSLLVSMCCGCSASGTMFIGKVASKGAGCFLGLGSSETVETAALCSLSCGRGLGRGLAEVAEKLV